MIIVTTAAIEKIKEISDSGGIGHTSVRLKVIGGGCAGMTQDMFYDDQLTDLDEVFPFDGITIIIDPLSYQYLEGVTLDYYSQGFSEGFKFINPNVTGSCGCGSSVSF